MIDPADPAGFGAPETNTTSVRADVVRLVREKRYEEALALLYRARAERPDDRELGPTIAQIKEFLCGSYAKQLGGLDQVAHPLPPGSARSPDALLIVRYIDGTSTFGDISEICPLGRLRTLQVLAALYAGTPNVPSQHDAVIPSGARPSAPKPPPEPEPVPPTKPQGGAPEETPMPSAVRGFTQPDTSEDRAFREAFARGTEAFVQRRYADAVEAFRECERIRPNEGAAATMLRQATRLAGI